MEFQFTNENKVDELGDVSQLSSVTLCNDNKNPPLDFFYSVCLLEGVKHGRANCAVHTSYSLTQQLSLSSCCSGPPIPSYGVEEGGTERQQQQKSTQRQSIQHRQCFSAL